MCPLLHFRSGPGAGGAADVTEPAAVLAAGEGPLPISDGEAAAAGELEVARLFRAVMKYEGSDLHLSVGLPPLMRLRGSIRPMDLPPLTGPDLERLRAMRTKDGTPLSASRLVQLATLSDEADRRAWLEALDRHGWTARELKARMQARPDKARAYGVEALDRALDGVAGTTVVHLCFGYAYVARNKPSGYSFLPELTGTIVEQISIEAAQPNLDLTTLDRLGNKTVIFGVISMGDPEPETPETVAARIRRALEHIPPERLIPAPDCGMKYIPREIAFAKLKALAEGAAIVRREFTGR